MTGGAGAAGTKGEAARKPGLRGGRRRRRQRRRRRRRRRRRGGPRAGRPGRLRAESGAVETWGRSGGGPGGGRSGAGRQLLWGTGNGGPLRAGRVGVQSFTLRWRWASGEPRGRAGAGAGDSGGWGDRGGSERGASAVFQLPSQPRRGGRL